MTPLERFWAKVDKTETCWLWAGSDNGRGYGHLVIDGQDRYAHRFAYELSVGPIPAGMELDHLCRVRRCVNPAHLEPVTPKENARRMGAQKTECPSGHPYDEQNTHVTKLGRRQCRTCHRERERARRAQMKHANPAEAVARGFTIQRRSA